MIWMIIFAIFAGAILAEIILKLWRATWWSRQVKIMQYTLATFKNNTDEDSRQSLLLQSGWRTLVLSLSFGALLVGMCLLASVPIFAMAWSASDAWIYLCVLGVWMTFWLIGRKHKNQVNRNGYSLIERILHRIALEPKVTRQLAFDLERKFFLHRNFAANRLASDSVFVCGLARSGTTILLRVLDESSAFQSLKYRDMPFVMSPNLWGLITKIAKKSVSLTERAHGDGLLVNADSPEGFEEVFWRTMGMTRVTSNTLEAITPSSAALASFKEYQELVANPRQVGNVTSSLRLRYLSKNNNNLMRLKAISSDPTAKVLIVYREPISTASSLYKQHLRFCKIQNKDSFVRKYMNWLSHHEFGLDHRPFAFALAGMDSSLTLDDPNYWLDYWSAVHGYLLTQQESNVFLINHNEFCSRPMEMFKALSSVLQIHIEKDALTTKLEDRGDRHDSSIEFSDDLVRRSTVLYQTLLKSSRNIQGSS